MKLKRWEWLIIGAIILMMFGIAYALDETITISYTPKGLTEGNYGPFRNALIYCDDTGGAIRFTFDGVLTPTSGTVGIKLYPGQAYILNVREQIVNFSAVRDSTTDGILQVSYWN